MKKVSSKILFLSVLALSLISCRDQNKFPDTPNLEYRSFTLQKASPNATFGNLLFELYFTDGDGDIGVDQAGPGDTTCAILNSRANLLVKYYQLINGVYVESPSLDTCNSIYYTTGEIPDITPTGSNPTLEGTIYYNMDPTFPIPNDSVKFEFILKDRSGKMSNVAFSNALLIQ